MKYISISGPVAAGKSTLLERILPCLGTRAAYHIEKPQNNPFISEYYSDSKRWSFHSQVTFLALYFDDMPKETPGQEFYFYDRCLIENLVLAKYRMENGDLSATEYGVIEKLAHGIESLMPPIDRYIYLNCSEKLLVEHLRSRGREYENALGMEYATHQKRLYDEWAAMLPKDKVLIVDQDRGADLEEILRFITA